MGTILDARKDGGAHPALHKKELATAEIIIGALFVPMGETVTLPETTEITGNVFVAGTLIAPKLETVGATLWADTTADITKVPVATLEALGNANRLELGIIGY